MCAGSGLPRGAPQLRRLNLHRLSPEPDVSGLRHVLFWIPMILIGFPRAVVATVLLSLGFQFFVHPGGGQKLSNRQLT